MKIIHQDLKKGQLKAQVENNDDLWYLSSIIEEYDIFKSKTLRKIKLSDGGERNTKVFTKVILISLAVEKVEFHKYTNLLRVSGKTIEGTDDVPRGVYHTFTLEPGTLFTLTKERFLRYHIDKLNEAKQQQKSHILICVFDREEAMFALLKKYGYDILSELKGAVMKKANPEKIKETFYQEIVEQLRAYDQKYGITKIVIGSPAFWKEYLLEVLEQDPLAKKVLLASCNHVGKSGIAEVLKRTEVVQALKDDRIIQEMHLVEALKLGIAKDDKAVYGFKDVQHTAEVGAVAQLLLTDAFIQKLRSEGKYHALDHVMKLVDSMQGEIRIISTDHEGGQELQGLGGIGALLRYKV
ncbi:mRNA surveillance protein pelota [Candidatus Woesearchaeota archaeon]|nr:mRNA surveillance protein pelota [Candidatus Woesearchaeota archaeon]